MDHNQEKDINIHGKIRPINISTEMRTSFLDYSMSVIVARALPDVRDGMKPVHRRILYAMNDLGMYADRPHKKSARIVGEVIGKYHPHGDAAVYETMVRMAQDFSYRYQLVEGHGNFGSIDGDSAAHMRYTEARMSKISMELMRDLGKETVDFIDNYDGEEKEPSVLPARFPNLLVNGTTGIAVGMATNIPPHNLKEVIDGIFAIMDQPDITVPELMNFVKGPDFPTGALILGRAGIKSAYETGRGSIIMRASANIEEMSNGKKQIIVTEIPYQVNKATLVEKIANLVREKLIEGITDLRDESNRNGIRIVIELRKDAQADVILNQLYRMTTMQSSFGVNALSLVNGVPKMLGLKEMLMYYLDHQVEVTERRTRFDLRKTEERAHILEGLRIALDHIDEIIHIIRTSDDDSHAVRRMMESFGLTEIQGKSIMDMRLKRLTGLERQKIEDEYSALMLMIQNLKEILNSKERLMQIIREELTDIAVRYQDARRSEIIDADYDVEDEDLIPQEDVVISLTVNGYIKRTSSDTYRLQNRGGRGIKGLSMHDDDVVDQFLTMSTHDWLCIFTNLGRIYRLKGYRVPAAGRTAKGLPVVNLLNLSKDETVKAMIKITPNPESKYLFFVTKEGIVKRTDIDEFRLIRQSGKIAITLRDNDELVAVRLTDGDDDVIIAGSNGKAVRFNEERVRVMGRTAAGVRGFNVDGGSVVGVTIARDGEYILSVSENGYGKKSKIDDYRLTNRGGKGVVTLKITEKNGPLVSVRSVQGDEDLLIMTSEGVIIRIPLEQVGVYSRYAQGVRLVSMHEGVTVATVALVDSEPEQQDDIENGVDEETSIETKAANIEEPIDNESD